MFQSDEERSGIIVGGGGRDGDDGQNDRGFTGNDDPNRTKKSGNESEKCGKEGKKLFLFRFGNVKKRLEARKKKVSLANSGCLGKRVGGYLCLKKPQTLDSPVESPTSDPNSTEFSYELLRVLIEKNDFYSKECNTHLDA